MREKAQSKIRGDHTPQHSRDLRINTRLVMYEGDAMELRNEAIRLKCDLDYTVQNMCETHNVQHNYTTQVARFVVVFTCESSKLKFQTDVRAILGKSI
jgi:hypothetical protein